MATTFSRNRRRAASKRLRASDVMTSNPVSIPHSVTARKAAELLSGCRIQTAPVTDEDGRLIGVVNTSILSEVCGSGWDPRADTSNCDLVSNTTNCGIYSAPSRAFSDPKVLQFMSPEVHRVRTDASIARVIKQFVKRNTRRLFVVDRDAVLVGEISIFELLRELGKLADPIRNARHRFQ